MAHQQTLLCRQFSEIKMADHTSVEEMVHQVMVDLKPHLLKAVGEAANLREHEFQEIINDIWRRYWPTYSTRQPKMWIKRTIAKN